MFLINFTYAKFHAIFVFFFNWQSSQVNRKISSKTPRNGVFKPKILTVSSDFFMVVCLTSRSLLSYKIYKKLLFFALFLDFFKTAYFHKIFKTLFLYLSHQSTELKFYRNVFSAGRNLFSATYQATFWFFFLFYYFFAILYFEPSVDISKILSAVGTPSSLADSLHNCM